uniref:Uncharacterized protein n=1 Tax=Solanum lycopersicum TaxID=4081 RepID=A0A3Q7EBT5_SOLLC
MFRLSKQLQQPISTHTYNLHDGVNSLSIIPITHLHCMRLIVLSFMKVMAVRVIRCSI